MTQHIHHDLIVQWAKDTTQVVEIKDKNGKWDQVVFLLWAEDREYRIRHKHQDLIDRKKERPELIVEAKYGLGNWILLDYEPRWYPDHEYRLVEPAKKKVKMWQWVMTNSGVYFTTHRFFKSAEDIHAANFENIIQRADWTEIEVEE